MRLEGKVAIVTGGASGIGLAVARRMAEDGAAVVIADLTGSRRAADDLAACNLRVTGIDTDVTVESQSAAMVAAAQQAFGGLDILVNNAAMFRTLQPGPFERITVAEWNRVMEVNALGPFLCAKAAVPAMRARGGGRIINITSNTVHKGVPNLLHYVTSKGALIAFTRALAREVGRDGVTVNAIAPGFTLSDGVLSNPAYDESYRRRVNEGRSVPRDQHPADLVGAVSFLASADAAFITGQTLIVDGGNVFV